MFAIKVTVPKEVHIFRQYSEESVERFFSQSIETLTKKGITHLILLTDGSDPEEVHTDETLVEAEKTLEFLEKENKYFVFKIVEYPEGTTNK